MADYPTKVYAEFTYDGAKVHWHELRPADLIVAAPRILEHEANLRATYRVALDDGDPTHITLTLDFKRAPDRADLVRIKGDVFAVLVDTSWGGSA